MELFALLCCTVFGILPVAVLFQSFLLRVVTSWITGEEIPWLRAVVTVLVASLVQGFCMGMFGGADAGACGSVAGFLAWVGMIAILNDLEFGKAAVIGLVMAVIQWLLALLLLGLAILFGITSMAGLAALTAV